MKLIPVNPDDVKALGIRDAYFLAQLRFYEKIDGIGRPFEKTPSQIEADLNLTPRQQKAARISLEKKGYIKYISKKYKFKWSCKFWIIK